MHGVVVSPWLSSLSSSSSSWDKQDDSKEKNYLFTEIYILRGLILYVVLRLKTKKNEKRPSISHLTHILTWLFSVLFIYFPFSLFYNFASSCLVYLSTEVVGIELCRDTMCSVCISVHFSGSTAADDAASWHILPLFLYAHFFLLDK